MGEVWKARDTRLNRIVAVKRLTEQHSGRFEQEARAIAALNHPHICQIYDVGADYLVLEYIEGQTLADRSARPEDLAYDRRRSFASRARLPRASRRHTGRGFFTATEAQQRDDHDERHGQAARFRSGEAGQ